MDVHKALNGLQSRIASEIIDGAHAYGLTAGDRALVSAFMRGVNRTAGLKFDHPGLGTTATRSGSKLVIQNDIGTTDAHVLVVHVEDARVTLTYTDVHMQRLMFFQGLFEKWRVDWDDTLSRTDRSMEEGVYHLCIGTYAATGAAELEEYLAFLGSRLVFLIDWNRARKRLRLLLSAQGGDGAAQVGGRQRLRAHGVPARGRRADDLRLAAVRLARAGVLRRPAGRRPRARGRGELHALRGPHLRPGPPRRAARGAHPRRGPRRARELLPLGPGERPRRGGRARGLRPGDRLRHPRRAREHRGRRRPPGRSRATRGAPRPGSTAPTSS